MVRVVVNVVAFARVLCTWARSTRALPVRMHGLALTHVPQALWYGTARGGGSGRRGGRGGIRRATEGGVAARPRGETARQRAAAGVRATAAAGAFICCGRARHAASRAARCRLSGMGEWHGADHSPLPGDCCGGCRRCRGAHHAASRAARYRPSGTREWHGADHSPPAVQW